MEEMLSYDSCYVLISLEDHDFCKIMRCNDSFLSSFGYKNRDEILQKNVREIIPRIIGNKHGEYVRKYIQTG